jgi:hypothetical protein
MKCEHGGEMLIVYMGPEELGHVLRFLKLCDEKFGPRFRQNKNFRHQMFDGLLLAIDDIEADEKARQTD